jgi:hypothetical protein
MKRREIAQVFSDLSYAGVRPCAVLRQKILCFPTRGMSEQLADLRARQIARAIGLDRKTFNESTTDVLRGSPKGSCQHIWDIHRECHCASYGESQK